MSNYREKIDKGVKLVLSIIYPLGAFFYSLKDLKSRSSYLAIFFFFIMYGLCFTAEKEAADSFRYVEDFYFFCSNPSGNYSMTTQEFFSKDSEVKDIYDVTLFYLTYAIAGRNKRVLFCLAAIIFALFNLGALKFLTKDVSFKNNAFFLLLVFLFAFSNPIFNINGFRFWTATWVAVFATFQVLIGEKKHYALLLLLTPMMHGSFYIYILFFILSFIIKRYYKILPYLFFISFFITDIALQILPDITDYLPSFLQQMVWNYTMSEEALMRMSGMGKQAIPLYAKILNSLPRYFHILLIYLLVRNREHFIDNKSKEFLGFLLAIGTLINMSSMIPSMGRYWYVLIPFYVYLCVHNSQVMVRYKKLIYTVPIIFLYPVFLLVRDILQTTDPLLFISNSVYIVVHSLMQ